MQSSTVSSKALKVLLAVILAIGLMPAMGTQKAFAAAGDITFTVVSDSSATPIQLTDPTYSGYTE